MLNAEDIYLNKIVTLGTRCRRRVPTCYTQPHTRRIAFSMELPVSQMSCEFPTNLARAPWPHADLLDAMNVNPSILQHDLLAAGGGLHCGLQKVNQQKPATKTSNAMFKLFLPTHASDPQKVSCC